jgi:hypothetical protein
LAHAKPRGIRPELVLNSRRAFTMAAPRDTGAHAATEKRGGGLLWLWLLLGALVLGLVIWAIAAALDDDDDDVDAGLPVVTDEVEEPEETEATEDAEETATTEATEDAEETATTEATEDAEETATTEPAEPSSADVGVILVGDVDILADETDLAALVGQPVEANTVEVRELVADEAFFVGPEVGQTVMVRLPAFAGEDEPESPFSVEQGDTVSFTGTLQEIDDALLSELQLYNPAEELETGQVYVQVEDISGVG